MNYYNEIDPGAAALLGELIKAGAIPNGIIDTRSIADVTPNDVRGFTQCHFFAGIAGWPLALRLAEWPDSRQIWTGSCPCQPFSQAGKGAGAADIRHLWPVWMHLIRQCKPEFVVGEQVASAIRHGWLDTVFDDLENSGYATGAANLPACSVGAPHLRERVWFVGALAGGELGNTSGSGLAGRPSVGGNNGQEFAPIERASGGFGTLGNTDSDRCEPRRITATPAGFGDSADAANWTGCEWLDCIDGKQRPTQPGLSPLAYGIPLSLGPISAEFQKLGIDAKNAKRLARAASAILRSARAFRGQQIRGFGNAIVPQVAAEFIRSLM